MKELLGPRQTVLVTTRGTIEHFGKAKEIDNVLPVDWHMPCSFEEFLYAVCIKKTHLSFQLINQSKTFIVNFIGPQHQNAVLICGTHSGSHLDKFKEAKLLKLQGSVVDCPKVAGALGYLECEVIKQLDCDDHVIFVGKVLYKELKGSHKRLYHLHGDIFKGIED